MKGKNTPEKTKNVEKAREEQKMGEKTIEKNAITEGVIWKQLLIFFFPIMLGTLIQQLYTTVDTIIVGRFVGKAALASVGGPAAVLSTIVVTFFNGLANGARLSSHNIMVQRTERVCMWDYIRHICSLL